MRSSVKSFKFLALFLSTFIFISNANAGPEELAQYAKFYERRVQAFNWSIFAPITNIISAPIVVSAASLRCAKDAPNESVLWGLSAVLAFAIAPPVAAICAPFSSVADHFIKKDVQKTLDLIKEVQANQIGPRLQELLASTQGISAEELLTKLSDFNFCPSEGSMRGLPDQSFPTDFMRIGLARLRNKNSTEYSFTTTLYTFSALKELNWASSMNAEEVEQNFPKENFESQQRDFAETAPSESYD